MERVRRHTERWAPRLALAIVASAAVHLVPLLVARRLARTAPLDIEMHVDAVEIGLEQARPGEHVTPPAAPPTSALPTQPSTPPPAPSATHDAPREHHRAPEPQTTARDTLPPLPTPSAQLNEPAMQLAHPTPHLVQPEDQQLQHDNTAANTADAGAPTTIPLPSMTNAIGDVVAMVPRGALFTILIRTDRVRVDPNVNAVRNVLTGIPDWDSMLGGTQLDPIRDLDEIVLAAANPTGAEGHPPDWFVIAKGAGGSDAAMRRAVEAMVAPAGGSAHASETSSMAPSPVNPPPLDGGVANPTTMLPDAGRVSPWRSVRGGAEQIDVERYGARRSFVMLGDGTAAIALPGQVDALLSAWSRRGESMVSRQDPRLSMLIEAEGVRNTISFNTWRGPFPMPTRAALGVYQQRTGGVPTGAVDLRSEWQYDDHAQAEHARVLFVYSRGRGQVMINARLGQQGGLSRLLAGVAASVVGIDIAALESAIDAMHFRAEGGRLVVSASLDERQVRALLNAAAMGGGGER